jgi:hypothetical protein
MSLTACLTDKVYIVPKIIHPTLPEPTIKPQIEFIPDGLYVKLSIEDAKLLGLYIVDTEQLAEIQGEYLIYYQTELKRFEESLME